MPTGTFSATALASSELLDGRFDSRSEIITMSSSLTLEHRLIFACARTDPDVDCIQKLITCGPDWQAIVLKAEQWRLAPLIFTSLRPLVSSELVPVLVIQQLRHLFRQDTIKSVTQRELLRGVLLRFAADGLPVIVLQGAALATLVYPSPPLRPIGTIDLLVHPYDREQAEKILSDIVADQANIPYLVSQSFNHLKLHDHLAPAHKTARLPTEDVWKRAQPVEIESIATRVLCHEDLLLHLALQFWASTSVDSHVRTLCDIGETSRRYGNAIDWYLLVMRAERYQVGRHLSCVLHLARDLVGADVPRPVLTALQTSFGELPFEDRFIVGETLLSDEQADTPSLTSAIATLTVGHDAGLTSCLSVRLHEVSTYWANHGHYPDEVDSSSQFQQYADNDHQHVAAMLLAPVSSAKHVPYIHFHFGQQFAWYRHLDLQGLQRLARQYCWPSKRVIDEAHVMMGSMQGRTAVLYRGNDKIQEIPRTPYETMFAMAERSGSHQFWVQTDEADFFDAFKTRFPDTTRIEALPMIQRDDTVSVLPQAGRVDFAVTFLSALYAIAHAPQIICTTGNTALWPMIFRGHIRGVWQYANAYPTYVYGEQSVWIMRDELGAALHDWLGEEYVADEMRGPGQH